MESSLLTACETGRFFFFGGGSIAWTSLLTEAEREVIAKESLTEVVLRLLKYERLLGLRARWAYLTKVLARRDLSPLAATSHPLPDSRAVARARADSLVPGPAQLSDPLHLQCKDGGSVHHRHCFGAAVHAGQRGRHGVD